MSTDLTRLRAEIKTWERDFATGHGRDPTVQDIRDQPLIADKYKLYKKLSKAAPSRAQPPSTPPQSHARLPVPKSRPVDSLPSLPGFNPFSPTKRAASTLQVSRTSPHPNPFATPAKNTWNPRQRRPAPSPHAFPPIPPPANPSSSHPTSTTAVSRARKRLRGEPVSPSPNKPKRQRIRSQPIPKSDQDSSSSGRESDQELPQCDFASSFVADSPVKAPAGGKSFKVLFDDALPALSIPKKLVGSSAAQLDSAPDAGFLQRASADAPVLPSLKPGSKSNNVASAPKQRVNRKMSADHPLAPSHKPTFKTVVSEISQPRTSMKRALDGGGDIIPEHTKPVVPLQSQYPLIPPSPPPQESINRDFGKGKGKATASRKKLRVEDEESDEGHSSNDVTLKVATVRFDRGKRSHRHTDDDWDPLLHLGTPNHDPAAKDQTDHASGTFSVDLPDKFHRVVAISPSRSQSGMEERVVRGLLYGDRVSHYDPSRGGDIWDAGETNEGTLGDADTEDDWEGEPVPWEVGEL